MKLFVLLICGVFMVNSATAVVIAKKEEKLHNFNSDIRKDDYFWMRDVNWPKVSNKEIIDHLKLENEFSEEYFAPLKNLQTEIYNEILGRVKEDDESFPTKKDNYYYYSRTEKGKSHSIHCRKLLSLDNKEEIILDENILAKNVSAFALSAFSVSSDHNLLGYSVDLFGEERYQIKIKDLASGNLLPDVIDNTIGGIVWHESEKGFFYNKLDEKWRSKKIYYHRLGDKQENDKLVYHEKNDMFSVAIGRSSDKKYLFIESGSSNENEIYYLDITQNDFSPKILIPKKNNQLYSIDHKKGEWFVSINDTGKNFRLIKVPVEKIGNKKDWTEIVPHNDDIYLVSFDISKDYLVVNRRINGINHITMFDEDYNHRNINFPEESYSASAFFPSYDAEFLRVSYSSLTTPSTLYEYDLKKSELLKRKVQEIPSGFDSSKYMSERVYATSKDGTKVPVSLVYRKDLFKKDGSNPTYLYGYGSYGISVAPSFRASIISLLDRGFVFAISHIRGGDDLGYKWYESAKFLNKKRSFDDFISTSEYLIDQKYTSSEKLVIVGGSAGGMLVGAVVNERPDLYKAVIALVPFVDVLNTMLDETLPLTPGEYKEWGNPKEKKYYDYIKSYSPYDNVKAQNYPAIFVTAGLNDPRVAYWEPAKWVAKLREFNTSKNPILLYTEMETGHKGASGRYDEIKEIAKIFSFAISQVTNESSHGE